MPATPNAPVKDESKTNAAPPAADQKAPAAADQKAPAAADQKAPAAADQKAPAAADQKAPPPAPVGVAAAAAGLVVGETAFLTAVHGRIVHPYQVPIEFDVGVIQKVKVDDWVVTQFEAGKLALAA